MVANKTIPDSKDHGANMGPTWILSAPDGPHVGPMNLVIREGTVVCWHPDFIRLHRGSSLPFLVVIQNQWKHCSILIQFQTTWALSQYKDCLSHVNDRRSRDHLIFNMGITVPVRRHLYTESAPTLQQTLQSQQMRCGENWHQSERTRKWITTDQ